METEWQKINEIIIKIGSGSPLQAKFNYFIFIRLLSEIPNHAIELIKTTECKQ